MVEPPIAFLPSFRPSTPKLFAEVFTYQRVLGQKSMSAKVMRGLLSDAGAKVGPIDSMNGFDLN
jgi:hypothetical protein